MIKKPEIYVCTNLRISGSSCASQGAAAVIQALRAERGVQDGKVLVRESVCMGYCGEGPNVKILGGDFLHGAVPGDAATLVEQALQQSARKDTAKT